MRFLLTLKNVVISETTIKYKILSIQNTCLISDSIDLLFLPWAYINVDIIVNKSFIKVENNFYLDLS